MIATDFAPDENWDDAWLSLRLIFQPWCWQKGKDLENLKSKLGQLFNPLSTTTRYVSLFLTGRSALYFFLKTLNLSKDSQVIVQAFTCEAVVLPIIANGLTPVYIDIETKTLSMDINDLKKKLTKKARVLILQHTFAMTPNYRKEIYDLAKKNNLFIIEDLAHGFDPKTTFEKQVTMLLSFGRSKSFSSVHGGSIITGNREVAKKLSRIEKGLKRPSCLFLLRALVYKPLTITIKTTYDFFLGKVIHKLANWLRILSPEITQKEKKGLYDNYFDRGYPNALAILLIHQLNKFERILNNRAKIKSFYQKSPGKTDLLINHYSNRLPVMVENRDQILTRTSKKGIFIGHWYDQVIAPKALNLSAVGYKTGSCPKAENICQRIINLPLNLDYQQAKKVIESIYGI